jgi:thioredoxin 1
MAHPDIVELTDQSFEAEVLKSDVPTLVDFWAVWCAPCRAIAPAVEQLATQFKGKVKVAKMNVDDHVLIPQKYEVRSIPTLLIFKNGQVAGQIVGAVPKAKIEEALKKVVA